MMRHPLLFSLGLVALATLTAQATPVILQHVSDITRMWNATTQLYIKGDVPISSAGLLDLEASLKNHPHWTVVLADSSKGERYQTPDGTEVRGKEAVAYVMGTGLAQTDQGTLTSPDTHLADGASLVILIKDHHINYSASAQQDKFGVGIKQWAGNLDQAAISDLRNGMRVAQAVQDTIGLIDQRIAEGIASAKRDFDSEATSVQTKLNTVQTELTSFQSNHPEAIGPIYHPALNTYQERITTAIQNHDVGQLQSVDADLDKIAANMTIYAKDLTLYNDLAKQNSSGALDQAHNALLQGDLVSADAQLQSIQHQIVTTRAAQTGELTWGILGMGGFVIVLLLKMWAVQAKRSQYLAKLKTWKTALAAKTDGLFELDKALETLALTPPDMMASAQVLYSGTTLELVLKALKTKDQLYIMSSYLHDLYDKAQAQVDKHSIQNWIFDSNYKKALNMLKSEPIRFQHNDPLRTLTQGDQKIDALSGRPEDYAEFTATADQLFDQFETLAKSTQKVITTLENPTQALQDGVAQVKKDEAEVRDLPFTPINERALTAQALKDPIGALNIVQNQHQHLTVLKETSVEVAHAKEDDFTHFTQPQQRELAKMRDDGEAYLKRGDGEKAHEIMQAFEQKRDLYQQQWQAIEDFLARQPALQDAFQTELERSQNQPWVDSNDVSTVKGLLRQAADFAQKRNVERSQQSYDQISKIQAEWATHRQEYTKAQLELERLRVQVQNSGAGMDQYREAQQRFNSGDYANTLIYTALAFQAMEDLRLELARAAQQSRFDSQSYSGSNSDSSSDSWGGGGGGGGSDGGGSDSGSSSSDSGGSSSGSSGSDW